MPPNSFLVFWICSCLPLSKLHWSVFFVHFAHDIYWSPQSGKYKQHWCNFLENIKSHLFYCHMCCLHWIYWHHSSYRDQPLPPVQCVICIASTLMVSACCWGQGKEDGVSTINAITAPSDNSDLQGGVIWSLFQVFKIAASTPGLLQLQQETRSKHR